MQVVAPENVPDLRIVWAAPPSSPVKAGEVVIKFDPSSAKQQLQEKEAALRQAQATLDQEIAQARITAEQDKLDLANAAYQVRKPGWRLRSKRLLARYKGRKTKSIWGWPKRI